MGMTSLTEVLGGSGELLSHLGGAPEPFVWKAFEDLAIACIILERGDIEAGGADWETIVHRDIKVDNGECQFDLEKSSMMLIRP